MPKIKKVSSVSEFIYSAMKEIERDEKIALEEFAKDASEKLREFTQSWYDSYQPTTYERTYEFINSITIEPTQYSAGSFNIGVYFDPNKMSVAENGPWIQHEDRFNLAEIIENGWEYRPDGSEAIFSTAEWADAGAFVDAMFKYFKGMGYRIGK